jgi:hypothetical protein
MNKYHELVSKSEDGPETDGDGWMESKERGMQGASNMTAGMSGGWWWLGSRWK